MFFSDLCNMDLEVCISYISVAFLLWRKELNTPLDMEIHFEMFFNILVWSFEEKCCFLHLLNKVRISSHGNLLRVCYY